MNIKISNGLNKNMKAISAFAIFISMLFVFALPLKASAIGQVTEPIIITNAQRGQEPQATLTVVNNDKTETEIGLAAKGDIASWTKFYSIKDLKNPIQNFKMSAGSQARVIARFNIPSDIRNGKYKGFVSVSKKFDNSAPGKDQSSASVAQQIDREVTIEINGEEIIGFDVSVIPESYDLKKDEPLGIRLVYDNRGNVSIAPQVQIKIRNDSQTIYNTIYFYPETQPAVKPGEIYEIPPTQILTNNLETGNYRAELSFSIDGKTIQEKNFGFSVGMVAESAAKTGMAGGSIFTGLLDRFAVNGKNNWILLVFAGMLMVYAFIRSKNRRLEINDANIDDDEKD